jgi:ABC-type Fe3+/spermidine/putrescine transport system ATPase subunit
MLEVKKVSLNYTTVNVVNNVSISINSGERLVILGPSGCGKTTLLKAISGFHPILKGSIKFNGQKIIDPREQLVPGHDLIKLVNQDFKLDDYHTVEENIRHRLLQFDKDYLTTRVEELLTLTELSKFKDSKAITLSGGQKQRLAIVRALADEPELLLLDEPFNQLDYHLKHKIESYILAYLTKYSISAILVSHNGEEAMRWADKIAFMKKGKIVRVDSSENFYNNPYNKYEAGFFGKMNTVLENKKEISFRPHHYSTEQTESHTIELELVYKSKTNKGWFTDYHYLVGRRTISLYSQQDLSKLTKIWIMKTTF